MNTDALFDAIHPVQALASTLAGFALILVLTRLKVPVWASILSGAAAVVMLFHVGGIVPLDQARPISQVQHNAIAQTAIMRNVTRRHQIAVIADHRDAVFFGGRPIDRNAFANHVVVANFHSPNFVSGLQVLRSSADDRAFGNLAIDAERRAGLDHDMRRNLAIIVQRNPVFDHGKCSD